MSGYGLTGRVHGMNGFLILVGTGLMRVLSGIFEKVTLGQYNLLLGLSELFRRLLRRFRITTVASNRLFLGVVTGITLGVWDHRIEAVIT
jgi:hypothetical protein